MDITLETCRAAIERAFPDLRGAPMTLLNEGWDSVGVDADDRLIFKFPRDADAEQGLVREHAILSIVRPHLTLRTPDMSLHEGDRIFSSHPKIPGDHLLTEDYERLSNDQRNAIGQSLGRFYAELHALDPALFAALPHVEFDPEPTDNDLRAGFASVLPADLRGFAEEALLARRALPSDPYGKVFSFFDGHGWNMAFDREQGVLNGVFDFADARLAPLQQDFTYSNFISRDLTERVIAAYEAMTGRRIDRARVRTLHSFQLVSEVAGWETYPEKLPKVLAIFRKWADESSAGKA